MWTTLLYYYLDHLKCVKFMIPNLRVAPLLVMLLCLVKVEVKFGRAANWISLGGLPKEQGASSSSLSTTTTKATKNSSLYECELSYLQMDLSMIKFSINYLEFDTKATGASDNDDERKKQTSSGQPKRFRLTQIDYNSTIDQLAKGTKFDARLPFVFFINGFNTFAPHDNINDTWMYEVARSFVERSNGHRSLRDAAGLGVACRRGWNLVSRFQRLIGAGRGVDADESLEIPFVKGRNVIFLTWSIPDLFANNLFAMIPAYYKTVANYDLIVDYVTGTLFKIVQLVELTNEFKSEEARSKYYSQFHFYGHSLGSHILSDAISRVVGELSSGALQRHSPSPLRIFGLPAVQNFPTKPIKFGKLMGLDPASPCFISLEYGISSSKVSEAVEEVVVLHSNAGFAGIPNERANLEIVLNGGTFQPGCVWYDFTCSHMRSTEILSYIDDECQMVAYKCTSYQHFKQGACETCSDSAEDEVESSLSSHETTIKSPISRGRRNCVLVNLPEQHRDKPQVLAYAEQMSNKTRQLATTASSSPWFWSKHLDWSKSGAQSSQDQQVVKLLANGIAATNVVDDETDAKTKMTYFHHVKTNANFRFGRKSHCLQHYQVRLLIYHEISSLRDKCKLSSFHVNHRDEIKLKLFYETTDADLDQPVRFTTSSRMAGRRQEWPIPSLRPLTRNETPTSSPPPNSQRQKLATKMFLDSDDPRIMSDQIKLDAVIKDVFHTALANFEAGPKLFVGAQLDNLDLIAMADCYRRANATSGPNFVLDIAFMSHTNQKIRYAYSSVLCGQLELPVAFDELATSKTTSNRNKSRGPAPGNMSLGAPSLDHGDLMLNLCKQSELKNVSAEIDRLLNQIKLQLLDENWKVSLLNSLFLLFTEWEPF